MKSCLFCKHAEYVEAYSHYYSTLTGSEFFPAELKCNGFGTGAFGKPGFRIEIENTADFSNAVKLTEQAETCPRYVVKEELR